MTSIRTDEVAEALLPGEAASREIRGRKSHTGLVSDSPAVKWTRVIRLSTEVGSSSAAVVWSCDAFLSRPQEKH